MTALNTPMLTAALGSATTLEKAAHQAALDPYASQSLAARNIVSPLKRPLLSAANILTVMAAPPVITTSLGQPQSITHSAVIVGSISGTTLTVSSVTSGIIFVGDVVTGGTTAANTQILRQLTGTPNGAGTYEVNNSQTAASVTGTSQTATGVGLASAVWKITAPNPGNHPTHNVLVPRLPNNDPNPGVYLSAETNCAAPVVEFPFIAFTSSFDIFVDGQLVRLAAYRTDASGSVYRVRLDWSGDANPWKLRHYRIAGFNLLCGGINVGSNGSASYPADREGRRLLYGFGDSYVQGTGAPSAARTALAVVADQLGMDYYADGIGSMGWNSGGANSVGTRTSRVLALLNREPDLIVSAYGYNDKGGDMVTLASNYSAWVAAARAAWPRATLRTLGPWTPTGPTSDINAVRTALFAQASLDAVVTVDISGIITLANSYVMTTSDNVHTKSGYGNEYLGRGIAPLLSATLPA